MKLNPLRENIAGKRLVVVDDSIVRGTTTRPMVAMLREAGATEVHFRVSSPPYRWPCFYGMDTGTRSSCSPPTCRSARSASYLGVDSLAYLDARPPGRRHRAPADAFCTACLTGEYPVPVPRRAGQARPRGGRGPHAPRSTRCRRRPVWAATIRAASQDGRERRATARGASVHLRGAGVDIAAGEKAVELIKEHVRSTFRPEVVGDIGGFGGLFAFDVARVPPTRCSCRRPTASAPSRWSPDSPAGYDTIGIDCVAMSVDDIAVPGRRAAVLPRLHLDRQARPATRSTSSSPASPRAAARPGCALLGGEMSEHPGVMEPGEFDLVGFAVGVVERSGVLPGGGRRRRRRSSACRHRGCAATATPSPGACCSTSPAGALDDPAWAGSARPRVADELLRPTVIYAPAMRGLLGARSRCTPFAHITGGGLPGNLARVLPRARRRPGRPGLVGGAAHLRRDPAHRRRRRRRDAQVFNLGIGMVAVVPPASVHKALDVLRTAGHRAVVIGEVVDGHGDVRFSD